MRGIVAVVVAASIAVGGAGCGGHPSPPKRGVVEADLGTWRFRRFQPVLDVEVWVTGNKAQAFTASYVADDAEKRGHIDDKDVVNVFVTRYEKPEGVTRETVKLARRLAAEQGYQVDEDKIGGARTLTINGHNESWVMWPSTGYVVKVGGRGRDNVPKAMVASYASRYPSVLAGGALEGPLPPGPDAPPKPDETKEKQPYDPNAPKPDLDKYDPKKVKVKPDRKGSGSGSDSGDDDN